ncbi:MAG TPA: aminotransferase class I/II-fold pyridoxal phosphate-dependent enzyme [Bacteroidales bacterium]|nr:aminotransferase class I/II-fold pyridoxal phosphate-dependent enzyme [Bacteroidales bacterium]
MAYKVKKIETQLTHDNCRKYEGAVVPPIFQNSLFTFEDWDAVDRAFNQPDKSFIYSRGKNPTVSIVEEKLAILAGAEKAQLFPSGMAAISAAIMYCVNSGDHVISMNNLYGPSNNFLINYLKPKYNIDTTFVQGNSIEDFEKAIMPNTRLIYLESPSTAVFSLQDIEAVSKLAKSKGIKTIIDNTWATPIYQKPLLLGVDIEIHSCSKYLGGHSDIVAGVLMGKAEIIDSIFKREYAWLGAKIAPIEAWLLLRSLRTLVIRMERHQVNAFKIAEFLENHPKIKFVRFPGLKSFPQYELGKKQMTGYSSLMSFQLKTEDIEKVKTFFNSLQLFHKGVSWGGFESMVYAPAISYIKELNAGQFRQMGISLSDIRISIGLENSDDLIEDLSQALNEIK